MKKILSFTLITATVFTLIACNDNNISQDQPMPIPTQEFGDLLYNADTMEKWLSPKKGSDPTQMVFCFLNFGDGTPCQLSGFGQTLNEDLNLIENDTSHFIYTGLGTPFTQTYDTTKPPKISGAFILSNMTIGTEVIKDMLDDKFKTGCNNFLFVPEKDTANNLSIRCRLYLVQLNCMTNKIVKISPLKKLENDSPAIVHTDSSGNKYVLINPCPPANLSIYVP